MASTAQLQAWLVEAQAAKHALATGKLKASVSYAGRQITFQATDGPRLDRHITDIERQLSGKTRRRTFRVHQSGTGY
jgi:hypothetical protein